MVATPAASTARPASRKARWCAWTNGWPAWARRLRISRIVFYSDSVNDVPLLEKVSQPVAANPSPALRKIAQERGWRVIDLFDHMEDSKS